MNLIKTTITITALSFHAQAAEFSFKPQVPFLSQQAEYLSAKLETPTISKDCMVDTGARLTIGKDSIFGLLEKVGEIQGGGLSNTNLPTDLVQTDVAVGDWKIESAIVARSERLPYDCLIGNDFFLGRAFEINFQKNKVSDIAPLSQDAYPLDVFPSDHGGHFGLSVVVANYSTTSLFDIGASKTVVDQKIVDANPAAFKFIRDLSGIDGNNQKIKATLYKLTNLKFGNIELKDIEVIAVDLAPLTEKIPNVDVVFGLDIIQKYNWSIDTKMKRWMIELISK